MKTGSNCCRFCNTKLETTFVELGLSPLANSYVKPDSLNKKDQFFPLHAFVCHKCLLVQLEDYESPDNIFSDYAYFSSYSESWLRHAKQYSEKMTALLGLGPNNLVVEVASNDGYLLKNFVQAKIPVLGVEPAKNVARTAESQGVRTHCDFFGSKVAAELKTKYGAADLMAANNVLAHVPNLNDFVEGFRILLAPDGVITFEFPHLLQLIAQVQFDTIYHEHFSYFSFLAVDQVMKAHNLRVFDVEELSTHGGSLRLFVCHEGSARWPTKPSIANLVKKEKEAGLDRLETYTKFEPEVVKIKDALLTFLKQAKQEGKTVVGYGAPAKGNTLLNYCGIGPDLIAYTVDLSPHKQGTYLPGSRIPVFAPNKILETKPHYVLILPWNIKAEIMAQMTGLREWGGKFVTSHPKLEVYG